MESYQDDTVDLWLEENNFDVAEETSAVEFFPPDEEGWSPSEIERVKYHIANYYNDKKQNNGNDFMTMASHVDNNISDMPSEESGASTSQGGDINTVSSSETFVCKTELIENPIYFQPKQQEDVTSSRLAVEEVANDMYSNTDWDTVIYVHNSKLKPGAAKSKASVNDSLRNGGADLDTRQKYNVGSNKKQAVSKDTLKLDQQTEELHHNTVSLSVGSLIQQGRQQKQMTQKELGTKTNEIAQVINEYEKESSAELNVHKRKHTGEKPFQCRICRKAFSRSCHLEVHLRSHTEEKRFHCGVCEKAFKRSTYLEVHLRSHTGEKPFQCEICEKAFRQSGHLEVHMRSHTDEKPFQCKICGNAFKQSTHLIIHMRSHNDEKPFQCEICEKSFTQSNNLTRHIRSHIGEKPFQCEVCGKAFKQSNNLVVHLRLHTGEKPSQ